jgi:hypothetical protein
MRDRKEEVHDHIFQQRLGFTIIDVGNWYQVSFPRVPSGRFEYAAINPSNEVYAGGTTPNMLMHQRDVGRITVQIIKDDRTLNKRVYACSEVLSQNDIYAIIEEKTGEKLQLKPVSPRPRVRESDASVPRDTELVCNGSRITVYQPVSRTEHHLLGQGSARRGLDFDDRVFSELVGKLVANILTPFLKDISHRHICHDCGGERSITRKPDGLDPPGQTGSGSILTQQISAW